MKRKFLAKAITLGLMLAVPLVVEAAHTLVGNTTVNGETIINSEAISIIGNQHQYNYTINGRLELRGGYIKEVNQLTFGTDGQESKFYAGSIEANNITVKGGLWTQGATSIHTSGNLLFVNNSQDTNNIKVLNCGTINAGSIESQIYFRNQGTIEVQNAIKANAGFSNENTTANITAGELIVEKSFNNKGNIIVDSITANLSSNNLANDSAANIRANQINVTSGGITNKGTITSKDENSKVAISSAGNINNMGSLLNIGSLTSNNGITNATGAIIKTDKITVTSGGITNKGTITSNRIESDGGIYSKGHLKSNTLVSNSTVTNGGYNTKNDPADPNSKMEVAGSLVAEAIINNGQLIADSLETQKNIANGNSAVLNINNTLKIDGILKNGGSLETKDLIISQASDNANSDSYSTGSLKVNGTLTLNEKAGFSFEGKKEGGDISIGTLETKGNNVISIKNGVTDINVGTLDGNNTIINVESDAANQIKIDQNNDEGLTVKGTGEMTDYYGNDIAGGLNKLKDTVGIKDGNKKTTLKLSAGSVTGDVTGYTNENGDMVGYNEGINKDNAGISEMASIALMAWRAENNDMNKRLGELRDSKGEHGIWTRMVRGQSKYGAQNVKNQYSTYQLGYDEKLSVDKNWTVGAAVSYTDASSSFSTGHGENKSTGFAVYGSYLSDNGSFVDLIAKTARLKNEFDVLGGAGKGDYETNGYSLSAEYGKRFTKDNGFWIEPQVELTYGYVGAVDYLTNNDVQVRQNGMDSLVGRIGFSMGRNIKAGNVYARASYLYDFDGETDVTFSKNNVTRGFEQDLGGGWWEVGVGTNINLSDATHLYFDVEKTYGGNVVTPWQWNAGVRWSF